MDENVNPSQDGHGTADPSTSLDNPENWNFSDPDDDQDNQDVAADEAEGETDEATDEDGQESENSDDDQEEGQDGDDADEDAAEIDETKLSGVTVTLSDGSQVDFPELKDGYLRRKDYQRKTQELANQRKKVGESESRLSATAEAFADFLAKQIPEPPDPQLMFTDPTRHYQMMQAHQIALNQVNTVLELGAKAKEVGGEISREDQIEALKAEDEKLVEMFPHAAKPDGRKKLFEQAKEGGLSLGYSAEELDAISDHRAVALAYYASIGLKAVEARKKAKAKVADAPPVTPAKRQKGSGEYRARRNAEAMKRLEQTGSIQDALAIDFD